MALIEVEIDVELDKFDTDDILTELDNRYSHRHATKSDKEYIEEYVRDFMSEYFPSEYDTENMSVADKMKYDFIMKHFNDLNLSDLEKIVEKK